MQEQTKISSLYEQIKADYNEALSMLEEIKIEIGEKQKWKKDF